MNIKNFVILVIANFVFLGLVSCKKPNKLLSQKFKNCYFEYLSEQTKIKWTGYKFIEKVGVNGQFTKHSINNFSKKNNIKESIEKVSFIIPISSLDSNNPDRDKKIKKQLFGTMKSSQNINGQVLQVTNEKIDMSISLNGLSKTITSSIKANIQKNQLKSNFYEVNLKTSINLEHFNAKNSVAALNNVCKALHTDATGKSKLWPDVGINILFYLKKTCQ